VTKTLTRTQRVYEALRTDILQGVRAPGSALRIQEIVDVHKVSMSVVREALVRLSEQHLVTLVEVSRVDLDDLVSTRIDLEGLALRRSIERGGLDWEARVISAHHVLDNTPMMASEAIGTTDEWTVAHTAFHEALESSCGSLRLSNFTRALRDSAEIYRQLSGRPNVGTRDIAGEHRELMELATARRAADAVESLRRHLMRTAEGVVREQFES
jgi:GntR family carbon starvation induced transcriptional regulator